MRQETTQPIVELSEVEKRYGDGPLILDKVGFAAERGDFITLIGPSGCGKSTILRLISGLNPPSSGRIVVDGLDPSGAVEKLAFVFQEPTLLLGTRCCATSSFPCACTEPIRPAELR